MLAAIAEQTGHPAPVVARVVSHSRVVVDDLLADGHVVVFDDLILSFGDSPTRRAIRTRLAAPEPIPAEVVALDPHAVADWLGLDYDTYTQRPLANQSLIGAELFDLLGDATPPREVVWDVLEAWTASFSDGRAYKVGTAGLEAAFENWLVDNLDRLAAHGLPVTLSHRQHVLPNRKRPDLLCRFTEETPQAKIGDWLVVELKATRFYSDAADQVQGYVEQVRQHLSTGDEQVFALLITDGADHAEIEELRQRGTAHLTTAALGYRLAIAQDAVEGTDLAASDPAPTFTGMDDTDDDLLLGPETSQSADGPGAYATHLRNDPAHLQAPSDAIDAIALALWTKREERRRQYEHRWGQSDAWPAQHPTTVLHLKRPHTLSAAVCIRCDWLTAAAPDTTEPCDLHELAKAHALEHPHASALDRGENPPRAPRDLHRLRRQARENARRAARRVNRRGED